MGQSVSTLLSIQILNADFARGVCFAAVSVSVYQIFKFLQSPSIDRLVETATKPVPKLGDDTKITVWGFTVANEEEYEQCNGDPSPYVLRVENYLRLKGKDYSKIKTNNLGENPRHKVPYANIYGTMIDDSGRILLHLQEKLGDAVESGLTDFQRAQGVMIRRLLFGSLYWVYTYEAFATKHGQRHFESNMTKEIPAAIYKILAPMIIRQEINMLKGVGIAVYPPSEVIEQGKADLRALNTILGNDKFFLGMSEPTVYDTDVYSFTGGTFFNPWSSSLDWVKEVRKDLPALEQHAARMKALVVSESKKVK